MFGSVLMLVAGALAAAPRALLPGAPIELAPHEGVLAVAVDTTQPLAMLRISGETRDHGDIVLDDIAPGRTIALYAVRAGAYRWDRAETPGEVGFDTSLDREYLFDVRAGIVNYPGDYVFRARGEERALLHIANRGLGVLDRIEREHPALAQLPFVYSGRYPDPFPAFYRNQRGVGAKPTRAVAAPPAPGPLPLAVETLWRSPSVDRFSLSPSGDRVALARRVDGEWVVELADPAAPERRTVVFTSATAVRELGWSGERRLIVSSAARGHGDAISVVDLADGQRGTVAVDVRRMPRTGRVVDRLPRDPDHLLIATRSKLGAAVHRVDIGSRAALDAASFAWKTRLNRGIEGDYTWLTDRQGQLRAATAADQLGTQVVYHGDGDRFAEVLRVADEHGFQPLRVSADGSAIIGLTEEQRGQRELVALDPVSREVRTLHARMHVDMQAPVFDYEHNLIGVNHYQHGLLQTHYFDPADQAVGDTLQRMFPQRSVTLIERDRSARYWLLMVEGSDAPRAVYHYDRDSGVARLVEQTRPWLRSHSLAPSHLVQATSRDGLSIEAYLTLPVGNGPRPLVVMPHGGPIGIRNHRHYDPEAQFIASLGYAVLQVNFRGSVGFGRQFREAGHNQLGRAIEDDIEAALAVALAQHPLDASRMCLVGSSYGGYSSLMTALRAPERFDCVASISGFTDRALQFTASDSGRAPEIRALLEQFIGNPNTELDAMTEGSPLYRYRQLDVPLLLAHGTEDVRVDYEQTRRLVRMLNLAGQRPTVVTLYGEGHSVETLSNREKLWHAVAGFLRQHI